MESMAKTHTDCNSNELEPTLNSPFAQSICNIINFKLSVESRAQPQSSQDVLL